MEIPNPPPLTQIATILSQFPISRIAADTKLAPATIRGIRDGTRTNPTMDLYDTLVQWCANHDPIPARNWHYITWPQLQHYIGLPIPLRYCTNPNDAIKLNNCVRKATVTLESYKEIVTIIKKMEAT